VQIPAEISDSHILSALEEIRSGRHRVPLIRESKKYVVRKDGKNYPPKYVICLANTFLSGELLPNEFHGGPEANNFLIRRGFDIFDTSVNPHRKLNLQAVGEDPLNIFQEGGQRALFKKHVMIERNPRLAKAAKDRRIAKCGKLDCDACDFSFAETYGDIGAGFIEAHHIVPLSELRGERKNRVEDVALLCANCHRMIHRVDPIPSIEQFRRILKRIN